ncbi:hypothetical protein L596_000585 [Steinernema carpocapsae]|uniref:Uncharacterized protein n=1 Tax=Steinernema carpocapsae TaxID=34508 RepID=A0A4U8UIW2_STECR|nr:hypothetical protein L596_000585 [Steinernema carpocapsae]
MLKDLEINKAKGLFGSLATKYNYILTDLPSEIIYFAKNPSDVIVTLKGALETQNLKSEPIHFTELRQLNGVFISAINLKDDAPGYVLARPREPRVLLTPEALQTIRLAFQGCYKELHICAPLPQELLEQVFQEIPDHIPAKLIHIKASKYSIAGACFKAAFIEFLKGLFFQKREERLNFKYTGRFDQAAEDLLIEAFHQERLAKICYNGVLGVTQLGRFEYSQLFSDV